MVHFNLIDWNTVALEAVATIREPVYPEHRLFKGKTKQIAQVKKGAKAERKRRKGTRELNEKLSRYYPLPGDQGVWRSPELLLKGKHGCDRSHS